MTDPVPITRKADKLREGIAAALLRTGSATAEASELSVTLTEWRKVARAAARQLGRPVETVVTETRAWAVLKDWPANDEEQAKLDAGMRAAMDAVGSSTGLRLIPSPGASSRT